MKIQRFKFLELTFIGFRQPVRTLVMCLVIMPFATNSNLWAQSTPIPEKAKEMYQKALVLLQENDYQGATKVLESTLGKFPQYHKAHLTLAELYLQANQTEQARDAFENIFQSEPELSFRPVWHLEAGACRSGFSNFERILGSFIGLP